MKAIPPILLDIFNYSDEQDVKGEGYVGAVMDYTKHPYIILGSVIRGVENFYIMCEMFRKQYGDKFDTIEEPLKQKYFDRLYGFLLRFDESNSEHILEAMRFDRSEVSYALLSMRVHFEEREQYENCVKIHNVLHNLMLV